MPQTIEQRVQEAENIIKKLYQDIAELEARRGSIQNEINAQLKEAAESSDVKHKERMEQLEHSYQKKSTELDERRKYLDDYMMRLDNEKSELASKEKIVNAKDSIIAQSEKEFNAHKDLALKEVDSARKTVEEEKARAEARFEQAVRKEALNIEKETKLNSQELSISIAVDKAKSAIADIDTKKADVEAILKQNDEKLLSIKQESSLIKEMLDDIQKQRDEMAKLSVYKDDIVKLEAARMELENKQKELKDFSKQVEARDVVVREKETSNQEKERYLTIKDREVSGKIDLLKKIRAGEGA